MISNFIGEYHVPESICTKLMDFFHHGDDVIRSEGQIGGGRVDASIKSSTDVVLMKNDWKTIPVINEYINELEKCTGKYIEEYPFCLQPGYRFQLSEPIRIQHYKPSEAFYGYHCERYNLSHRHLTFVTYLNTVKDKGETEFYYQKVKVSPIIGKTAIFPAEWMHTHRGVPSSTEEKYIITGWYEFISATKTHFKRGKLKIWKK